MILALVFPCGESTTGKTDASPPRVWEPGPELLAPTSNNAVAAVQTDGGCMIFSLLGIGAGLGRGDIHNHGYRLREGDSEWLQLPDVPGPGRLAASAVSLRGTVYLPGGDSAAFGGVETSHDSLQYFDLVGGQWVDAAPIPVPIDDAVALTWRDRWIVVVSGWSNTRNVDAVQMYDVQTDTWASGTAFPGTPAFGHTGALARESDTMVILDGAASSAGFPAVSQAWRGALDPNNPTQIVWSDLGTHPGPPRYRAAGGADARGRLWFHGGAQTPYNFDGLSYANGSPSQPLATTLWVEPATGAFTESSELKPTATMDHRSLAHCDDTFYLVGGMVAGPEVTSGVWLH